MNTRLIVLLSCLFLSACAGRQPDAYDDYQARRLERMALSVLTVSGTVVDSGGKAISELRVKVSSPRFSQEARTASDGHFSVEAKFAPDDELDFHFSGEGIDWTETIVSVPRGVEKIHARFVLEKSGKIRLAGLVY